MQKFIQLSFLFLVFNFKSFSQCPPGTNPTGTQLVINGDFSQGNTGFTTQYTYCASFGCMNEGYYGVDSNPNNYHVDFEGSDHTTGTGNFLFANGALTPNVQVWCQTVNVTPNTEYTFSTWAITVAGSYAPAELQFTINGNPVGSGFVAPDTFHTWEYHYATWNSGANTTADLCIITTSTWFGGNDFGLDDISFIQCNCNVNLTISNNTTICEGESVQLNASGATSYAWSPTTGLSNPSIPDPIASPTVTTTYILTALDSNCISIDSVTITVIPAFTVDAGIPGTICEGESVQLNATTTAPGNASFAWTPASSLSNAAIPNPIATPVVNTTYHLTVSSGVCSVSDSVEINVNPIPDADAGPDINIDAGDSATINAVATGSVKWTPSTALSCDTCSNVVASPLETTTYLLTVTLNGCTGTDSVTVFVNEISPPEFTEDPYLFIPNIFTPGNINGFNDNFEIKLKGYFDYSWKVFNRWGQELFSSDKELVWNGNHSSGEPAPAGTYYYIFHLNDINEIFTGHITLIR